MSTEGKRRGVAHHISMSLDESISLHPGEVRGNHLFYRFYCLPTKTTLLRKGLDI